MEIIRLNSYRDDRFSQEAKRRKIFSPKDMIPVTHGEYEEKWTNFCKAYFAKEREQ